VARRDRLIRQCLRDRFVLTLHSGETFEGLLLDVDDKTVVLADAFALTGSDRVAVDGTLYLPRAEVSYMQRPEARG
jgi:hypothetical protein